MSDLRWKRLICRGRVEYHADTEDGGRVFVRSVGGGVWIWYADVDVDLGKWADGWDSMAESAKLRAERAAKGGDRD